MHVKVRYCKAPVRLRYKVGSSYEVPAEVLSFCLASTGVAEGLHEVMPTRAI
ncbi:hypothetical protein A2U01_0085636, partial [Trifolium medium]|nr:hypothetical protein [Trifolium medium]